MANKFILWLWKIKEKKTNKQTNKQKQKQKTTVLVLWFIDSLKDIGSEQ